MIYKGGASLGLSVLNNVGLAMDWMVRGSNLGGGELFRTRQDLPWGPPKLLYNFPGMKRPGCDINHVPKSSAEVEERVELYPYSSSGPSWSVTG